MLNVKTFLTENDMEKIIIQESIGIIQNFKSQIR